MSKNETKLYNSPYLTGQLLVAMPQIQDPRFSRAVVLICGHDENGAMGLVLNKLIETMSMKDLLKQLDLSYIENSDYVPVHCGGPVEMGRGFILHSTDYMHETSVKIIDNVALSATIEILTDIIGGLGPRHQFLALGYAGWSAGQLDEELQQNSWLQVEADDSLIFADHRMDKWELALDKLGVDPRLLSTECGRA